MLWGWWVASFYRRCKHFNVTNLTITPFKLAHELGEINIYTGKQERFQLFRGFSIHKKWSNRSTMPPMLQCFIAFLQCFSAFLGFLVHHSFYWETKTNMGRGSSSSGITTVVDWDKYGHPLEEKNLGPLWFFHQFECQFQNCLRNCSRSVINQNPNFLGHMPFLHCKISTCSDWFAKLFVN